jgi:hypothetical protein
MAHLNEKSPPHSVSPRSIHFALVPAVIMNRAKKLRNCIVKDLLAECVKLVVCKCVEKTLVTDGLFGL